MAQMKLDTSGLERISNGDLDSKKERQAILDYLYQLTEQLRYWQNNLEQDNLTESFSRDIDGIRSTVEDAEGNISKIIQRAEIPDDARFHDLRHSFAVTSLYAGDDIKTVQTNLGHATAQFTLDTYGHVTQKMRQDSANRMQHFYEQLSK